MERARILSRVKQLQLLSHKLVESLLAGNYRSVFKGPGIEFDEVREYVEGDDARLIDWNVSSRMTTAFAKTYREERELTLFLIVDLSGSVSRGLRNEMRREVQSVLFSLLTFAAVQNNDKVGALFFTDRIEHWVTPVKGRKHATRLVEDMIAFEPEGRGSDLSLALRAAGEALKRRGICVVLSDFKTAGYLRELSLLARRHDVIAVRVSDPLDYEYPRTGLVQLEDPETGRTVLASGLSRKFRKQYREYWEVQRLQWRRDCRRRGIATLEVSTEDDPVGRLIEFFRRRKAR
ncbi:MAG: DUF58 domain-containing protein [Spirochaetaceae bacterium]